MSEPRKKVVILGNGFDLDLGLKTLYKDFWESKYCPKDYRNLERFPEDFMFVLTRDEYKALIINMRSQFKTLRKTGHNL